MAVVKKAAKKPAKKKRNYRKEYDNYHASPEQKKNRANRNKQNAKLRRAGVIRKGDGNDAAHTDGNPRSANVRAQPKSKNRSYARTKTARKRNPRS